MLESRKIFGFRCCEREKRSFGIFFRQTVSRKQGIVTDLDAARMKRGHLGTDAARVRRNAREVRGRGGWILFSKLFMGVRGISSYRIFTVSPATFSIGTEWVE